MKTRLLIPSLLLVSFFLQFASCRKKDPKVDPPAGEVFDKQGLLVNQADNFIIPAYETFALSLDSLQAVAAVFNNSPDVAGADRIRTWLKKTWSDYQLISPYNFGPAEEQGVQVNFNIFPTDTAQIKANISSGTYNLSTAANVDAKGLPALDFLFNARSQQGTVSMFTSASYRKYVQDLLTEMNSKCDAVLAGWKSGYRNKFVSSLGTDVGSSIGFLINQMNFELDYLKNSKFATPLGLRSGGAPLPDNTEAYFSGYSIELALQTLEAIRLIYTGGNGKGFDDYADHLGLKHSGGTLNAAILARFQSCKEKIMNIGDPLSQTVVTEPAKVDAAYKELVMLLVLLKTDLPSGMGVVITYQDGDGD